MLSLLFLTTACTTTSPTVGLDEIASPVAAAQVNPLVEMRFGTALLPEGAAVDLDELDSRGLDTTTLTTADGTRYELTWRFGELDEAYVLFKEVGLGVDPAADGSFGALVEDDGGLRCVYVTGDDGVLLFQSREAEGEQCPAAERTLPDLAVVDQVDLTLDDMAELDLAWGTYVGTYNSVKAYSNGSTSYVGPYGTYGYQYQCVEYVNRYFVAAKGKSNMRGTGNAKNYCSGRPTGISVYSNGGTTAPRTGDFLVSQGGTYGHIAVIREVGSNYVKVIHQNWSNTTSDNSKTLTMTVSGGRYTISGFSGSYPVACWGR